MSSSNKETRASGRSPSKDPLKPIVLVEDLHSISSIKDCAENNRRNGSFSSSSSSVGASFKLEDLPPREKLLGSVTFAPIRSGPVRTSARVIQKMLQDTRPGTPPTTVSCTDGNDTPFSHFTTSTNAAYSSSSSASGAMATNGGGGISGASAATSSATGFSSATAFTATGTSSSAATGGAGSSSSNVTVTTNNSRSEKAVSAPKTPTTHQSKQPKRLWSNMERGLFFEALNEYGKDFEAITQHINQKMRRKGAGTETASKSIQQVRQLYLQTLQKASRYLRFSDDVKKVPQELYALINYGEMRRKMPFMNEKAFMKLKDLVYCGSVTLRDKGKTVRIRTPSCRALRKLNQLEEWQEEVTLPQRIEINLLPATMESWGRVQSLAQNPRVKTTLPLYKRVSCLLKFLQNKWRGQEMRLCEKTMSYQPSSAFPNSSSSSSSRSKNHPANNKGLNNSTRPLNNPLPLVDELASLEPLLCLAPPAKTIIHRPMVNLTDFSNSYSICLNSYEDRIGAQVRGKELAVEKFLTHKERAMNGKRLRLDSGGESGGKKGEKEKKAPGKGESNSDGETTKCASGTMDVVQSEEELARPHSPLDIQTFDLEVMATTEDRDDRIDLFSDNSEDKRLGPAKSDAEAEKEVKAATATATAATTVPSSSNTTGGGGSSSRGGSSKRGKTEGAAGGSRPSGRAAAAFKPLISEEVIRKIKEGWTVNTCGDLTFGDLYVMFGNDFKISLEYKWVPRKVEKVVPVGVEEQAKNEVKKEEEDEAAAESHKEPEVDKEMEQLMGRRLGQLLMIANLMDKKSLKNKKKKMKENDYPYPESNLFKHPALPLRYSHYNGYNSTPHLRRQKPRPVYPFPSPKPFMSAPKYYHHTGRPSYTRPPLPQEEEAGQDGDAEDDGDEGTSGAQKPFLLARRTGGFAGPAPVVVQKVPVAVQTTVTQTEGTSTTIASCSATGEVSMDAEEADGDEDEEEEEEETTDGDEEGDYSKNPGLLSLLEISLPSIREEELLRATESSRGQGWLEDNMNDYSFSSLLGHIDMHLNCVAAATGSGKESENGSTTGEESPEKRPSGGQVGSSSSSGLTSGTAGMSLSSSSSAALISLRNDGMLSDRCSVISESSVDFVKKFAEMAGMMEDH